MTDSISTFNCSSNDVVNTTGVFMSFCNQIASPDCSLCLIDCKGDLFKWIDLSVVFDAAQTGFVGVCGIVELGGQLVLVTQGEYPVLAILNCDTAQLKSYSRLEKCIDPHSIACVDGHVYVVSTGTNQIFRVRVEDGELGREELFWSYPGTCSDRDEVHLNGLAADGNDLIATCFGPRSPDGSWGSQGRVFSVNTDTTILGGLRQPHSPSVTSRYLAVAESAASRLHVFRRESSWARLHDVPLHGYPRGLAFRGSHLLVGISANRSLSRSQQRKIDNGRPNHDSALLTVNLDTGAVISEVSLLRYGREPYEILAVDVKAELCNQTDSISRRIRSMESSVDRYAADLGDLHLRSQSEKRDSMLVSVILPTYNRAHLISDSIRSVLNQSYPHFEVIIVDDGSTDNTAEIIADISDPRIRYVRQPNRGRSNARNHALSLAQGRYIAFLDSDDQYLPDKLERQVAYLRAHPGTGMVYTSAHCIDQQGVMLGHKYHATVSGCIYESIAFFVPVTITLPTVMTYREIMNCVGGFDEAMYRFEDTDMWRRISKVCRIDAMADFTCLLRTHDDNSLANQNAEQIAAAIDYYAEKILRDDESIELAVRRCGLANLYRYYGHAMLSVPAFADIGGRLLERALNFVRPAPVYSVFRKGPPSYPSLSLSKVRHYGRETGKALVYWTRWAFRFVYYRSLNYGYQLYSRIKKPFGRK